MPKKTRTITVAIRGQEFSLSEDESRALVGQIASRMRGTFGAGPGRPRTVTRCPCGAMSVARAEKKRHVCFPTVREGENIAAPVAEGKGEKGKRGKAA